MKDTNGESVAVHDVVRGTDWHLAIGMALAFLTTASVFMAGLHEDRLYQLITTTLRVISALLT